MTYLLSKRIKCFPPIIRWRETVNFRDNDGVVVFVFRRCFRKAPFSKCFPTTETKMHGWRVEIDLFHFGGLFSYYRPRDILQRIVLLSIYQVFENLKARILKSSITCSGMGQPTAQAKKFYSSSLKSFFSQRPVFVTD